MKNRTVWAIGGVVGLLVGALVGTQLSAQRAPPRPEMAPHVPPQAGRFVLVKIYDDVPNTILLLDTVTGDTYKTAFEDAKKYSTRPKVGGVPAIWRPPADDRKDGPPRDFKETRKKEADGFKDKKEDGDKDKFKDK